MHYKCDVCTTQFKALSCCVKNLRTDNFRVIIMSAMPDVGWQSHFGGFQTSILK